MFKNDLIILLNSLKNTPVEQWPRNIRLKAVSANSSGIVDSGILSNGTHFYRKHEFVDGAFTGQSKIVLG